MKKDFFIKSKTASIAAAIALCLWFFVPNVFAQNIKSEKNERKSDETAPGKYDADEIKILDLINLERERHGLSRLAADEQVADIARDYSEKMAAENFFSHYDAQGNSVLERAKAARLKRWSKIGENLFSVENLAKFAGFAVKSWLESPSHRENILDPDWTTTGIGIAESDGGEIFITQIFIKRL